MSVARLSPQARVDLLEIWHHIALDSLQNANAVWEDLKANIRKLADQPGLGHQRRDVVDSTLRFWAVHSYIIAYKHDAKRLEVVRVVSGHRDFKRLFKKAARRRPRQPRA